MMRFEGFLALSHVLLLLCYRINGIEVNETQVNVTTMFTVAPTFSSTVRLFSPRLQIGRSHAVPIRNATDEEKLTYRLFRFYDARVRPVEPDRARDRVLVDMRLSLFAIPNLDELKEVIEYDVWLEMSWTDKRLTWKESLYNGVKTMSIPMKKVWVPDVVVYNSADMADVRNTQGRRALVDSNGRVKLAPYVKLHTPCRMDLSLYPFDEHTCKIIFGSWSYDDTQVVLVNLSATADTSQFRHNGKWDIVNTKLEASSGRRLTFFSKSPMPGYYKKKIGGSLETLTEHLDEDVERQVVIEHEMKRMNKTHQHLTMISTINCYIRMKRRLLLNHIINIFVPCSLIAAVTLMCFLLPHSSRSKISLSVHGQLSLLLFLFLVAKSTPSTSDSISILTTYLLFTMSLAGCVVMVEIFILNLHHLGNAKRCPVPPWLRRIVIDLIAPLVGFNRATLRSAMLVKEKPRRSSLKRSLSGSLKNLALSLLTFNELDFDNPQMCPAHSMTKPMSLEEQAEVMIQRIRCVVESHKRKMPNKRPNKRPIRRTESFSRISTRPARDFMTPPPTKQVSRASSIILADYCENQLEKEKKEHEEMQMLLILNSVSETLSYILVRQQEKRLTTAWLSEWRVVSMVLDRFAFYLFLISLVGSNLLLLLYLPFIKHQGHVDNTEESFVLGESWSI